MVSNSERADWASISLQAFADEVMAGNVDEETVQDLVCDLGHFVRLRLGYSRGEVQALFRSAIGAWSAEDREPSGEPRSNDLVDITITEAT